MTADSNDPRWGGYVPWFFRHEDFVGQGDFSIFFSRLRQRLETLFKFNEAGVENLSHFGARLETETLQRFRNDATVPINFTVLAYFDPELIARESVARAKLDKIELSFLKLSQQLEADRAYLFRVPGRIVIPRLPEPTTASVEALKEDVNRLDQERRKTRKEREQGHYMQSVVERLGVLEVLLRVLPGETGWKAVLIQDIQRFFAESKLMLDIRTAEASPPRIVPLDEPLLQKQVVDMLLPRLSSNYPDRAKELLNAYHDLLGGKDGDSIFAEAFKSLEQLARDMTGDGGFMFEKAHLAQQFPLLHGTIHQTMIRLAGHRGDKAGHGKDAPPHHEIRYLLFAICNTALLLLDYPRS